MSEIKKDKKIEEIKRVFGYNKERDLFILQTLANGYTYRETLTFVAEQFPNEGLKSEGDITRIKNNNRELLDELTFKSEFATKAGRIRFANRILRKKRDISKKDTLDWIEHIRKEQLEEGGIPPIIVFERGIPVPESVEEVEEAEEAEKS